MRRKRPQPTLADYMAIAISPALIMVLVGSLAFFLLGVFYRGEFESRLYWTTGCFVFASVLISRVSIEEGAERAALLGLALGGAVALAMIRLTDNPLGAWLVLAVIWWAASHLVWNCTLVDGADDASGEGLLEAAGFEAVPAAATSTAETSTAPKVTNESSAAIALLRRRKAAEQAAKDTASEAKITNTQKAPPQGWRRVMAWWQRSSAQKAPPGLWVIYFSLAALPVFGIGQVFIPDDGRLFAFSLMFWYVASALGLLLMTSFLGLRRYLRQRKLEMPIEMAGAWLGVGASLAAAILVVAMLIPRPNPEYAVSSLTGSLGSPQRQANSQAPLRDSPGQGDSQAKGAANAQTHQAEEPPPEQATNSDATKSAQTSPDAQGASSQSPQPASQSQPPGAAGSQPSQSPAQPSANGQQSSGGKAANNDSQKSTPQSQSGQNQQQDANQQQNANEQQRQPPSPSHNESSSSGASKPSADRQSQQEPAQKDPKKEDEEKRKQEPSEARVKGLNSPKPTPPLPTGSSWFPSSILSALKFLLYVAIAIVGIYFFLRYRHEVLAWLGQLWREVLDIWQSLFGGRQVAEDVPADPVGEAPAPSRPFSSYRDPFASGDVRRQPANAIVQYSFEALEAWSAERGFGRLADETPLEFAARLANGRDSLGTDVRELASLYARVAYAREELSPDTLGGVQRLWQTMRKTTGELSAAR